MELGIVRSPCSHHPVKRGRANFMMKGPDSTDQVGQPKGDTLIFSASGWEVVGFTPASPRGLSQRLRPETDGASQSNDQFPRMQGARAVKPDLGLL